MRRPDVLVLSDAHDASVRMVTDRLPADVDALWWDDHDYPSRARLAISVGPDGHDTTLLDTEQGRVDLGGVAAGWLRRPGRPAAADSLQNATLRHYADAASRYVLAGLWACLGAAWLPAPPGLAAVADNKLAVLRAARDVGLTVPSTLVTNDPDALVSTWLAVGGDLVAKTPRVETVELDGRPRHMFTTRVTRDDLVRKRSIAQAPVILQQNVEKEVELRVTVVGDQIFCAALSVTRSSRGRQDWRRSFGAGVDYHVHSLPEIVAERCLALMRRVGLAFGAIDMIVTPDGEYVFLEVNAGGQWAWIELETDLPIAAAIAGWLVRRVEESRG